MDGSDGEVESDDAVADDELEHFCGVCHVEVAGDLAAEVGHGGLVGVVVVGVARARRGGRCVLGAARVVRHVLQRDGRARQIAAEELLLRRRAPQLQRHARLGAPRAHRARHLAQQTVHRLGPQSRRQVQLERPTQPLLVQLQRVRATATFGTANRSRAILCGGRSLVCTAPPLDARRVALARVLVAAARVGGAAEELRAARVELLEALAAALESDDGRGEEGEAVVFAPARAAALRVLDDGA